MMIDLTHFGLSPDLLIRLREGRTILTGGIWYWFPTPDGWDLLGFNAHGPLTATTPPDDQANVFHVQEFEEIVGQMTKAWRLDSLPLTRDTYQGIPRGRVSKDAEGTWNLEHGGEFATRHIKQLFGLNGQPCQEFLIGHEMTDPRHVEIVEKTILYKTEDDGRLVHAFEALRNHRAVPGTTCSHSANAQVSMSIEESRRGSEAIDRLLNDAYRRGAGMDELPDIIQMRDSRRVLSTLNSQKKSSLRRPDLEAILHNEKYNASMREGVRAYLREVALVLAKEQQRPLTGAYYWVPLPPGSDQNVQWTLQAFFDDWRPNSDHVYVWRHVQDSLRTKWRRSFEGIEYCGLPRGRVSRIINPRSSMRPGPPVIYHGGDAPIGFGGLDEVRRSFNLPATTPVVFDEHEQMISGQPYVLAAERAIPLFGKGLLRLAVGQPPGLS